MNWAEILRRREFFRLSGAGASIAVAGDGPTAHRNPSTASAAGLAGAGIDRPRLDQGILIGEVEHHRALLFTRCDRPARVLVEWDTNSRFTHARRVAGPLAQEDSDFTTHVTLDHLPAGEYIYVRVMAQSPFGARALSQPVHGRFRTASQEPTLLRFLWSGQGGVPAGGTSPELGGPSMYETMRRRVPDFYIHCKPHLSVDAPCAEALRAESGHTQQDPLTHGHGLQARAFEGLREHYRNSQMDAHAQRFNSEVPQLWLGDVQALVDSSAPPAQERKEYTRRTSAECLSKGATDATDATDATGQQGYGYRHVSHGPQLDLFVVDLRRHRGPPIPAGNDHDDDHDDDHDKVAQAHAEAVPSALERLKQGLLQARGTWKVIATDRPLGLRPSNAPPEPQATGIRATGIRASKKRTKTAAHPLLDLHRFIQAQHIANVVWITADPQNAACIYYEPAHAALRDFMGFWEFVAGPLHAPSILPAQLDPAFGPELRSQVALPKGSPSPIASQQGFGQVDIEPMTHDMTVTIVDLHGHTVHEQRLQPQSQTKRLSKPATGSKESATDAYASGAAPLVT